MFSLTISNSSSPLISLIFQAIFLPFFSSCSHTHSPTINLVFNRYKFFIMASISRSVGFPSFLGAAVGLIPRVTIQRTAIPVSQRLEDFVREKLAQLGQALPQIDVGLWKAAPKKRPSKRRTRINFLAAGKKQVKHMHNLVRCPACGHVKRAHFMCMHCFAEIRYFLRDKKRQALGLVDKLKGKAPELDDVDRNILYPGKYTSYEEHKLQAKRWIPKREDTLMHDLEHLKKRTKKTYLEED